MSAFDHDKQQFSQVDVQIIAKVSLFEGFFKMVKYRFKHRLFAGGWSEVVERELFERGHAAALLPYDPITDQVVIVEQIRVGALETANPWQYEIVAGMIETGESVESVVRREAQEEAGITIARVLPVTSYYPSSGGCSEKLDVFIGEVDATTARGIHGLDCESEDIKVHVLARTEALQWLQDGHFENGASIIALQWLALNYQQIHQQWLA